MKITCVSTSVIPAPTAHSMQLMKVCQALAQLGHKVKLVVPGVSGAGWETLSAHYGLSEHFDIHYIKSHKAYRRYDFALRAIFLARHDQCDLIYTWLLPAAVMALWAGIPIVYEMHDRITGKAAPWFFRRLIGSRKGKRLAVITQALAEIIKQTYHHTAGTLDMVIAPNGVELERYEKLPSPQRARKQLGLPEKMTVVYTGSFYAGRGIELLYTLAGLNPGIQFIWAGGTPESIKIWQDRIITEGLNNIYIQGYINNQMLPLYQSAADILVMPFGQSISGSSGGNSVDICSPMKMFDYLASGRAIMASDLPVLHEVLNERNAVLLPPEEINAWQHALLHLALDSHLRMNLGHQARIDAAKYTWVKREKTILKGISIT
ncbi:MAG: glycosyltransferase [Anaerolineaceae bacterium]|nr:glycosyltransferase [Anaerolineaceae bacterium]MBN2676974.1 glycosyltransferase [Anaerolineaceae bacterium]